jgi:NADH:ubiquinone oxidoreductase subunit 2 (subunit N)
MFTVLLMTVIEAHYLFRVVTILYGKQPEGTDFKPHRIGDVFSATVLGVSLLIATVYIRDVANWLDTVATEAVTVTISQGGSNEHAG